ncbi:hypothetical protein DID77_00430 [Candidatus Marinamargulisbacteria bacterium SCGC AG-439-L15]|nr:hypothetical protein DID77_00430 [Candidatus Marinamargulisbacteria bacterium SCGC AG-439-L15]
MSTIGPSRLSRVLLPKPVDPRGVKKSLDQSRGGTVVPKPVSLPKLVPFPCSKQAFIDTKSMFKELNTCPDQFTGVSYLQIFPNLCLFFSGLKDEASKDQLSWLNHGIRQLKCLIREYHKYGLSDKLVFSQKGRKQSSSDSRHSFSSLKYLEDGERELFLQATVSKARTDDFLKSSFDKSGSYKRVRGATLYNKDGTYCPVVVLKRQTPLDPRSVSDLARERRLPIQIQESNNFNSESGPLLVYWSINKHSDGTKTPFNSQKYKRLGINVLSISQQLSSVRHASISDAFLYVCELAKGISDLHKLGYIHGDVKCQNTLQRQDGAYVLTDFGFCRSFLDLRQSHSKISLGSYGQPRLSQKLTEEKSLTDVDFQSIDWYALRNTVSSLSFDKKGYHDEFIEDFDRVMNFCYLLGVPTKVLFDDSFQDKDVFRDEIKILSTLKNKTDAEISQFLVRQINSFFKGCSIE